MCHFNTGFTAGTRFAAFIASAEASNRPSLSPDCGVEVAIRCASEVLGREPGEQELELTNKLKDNWYSSAGDIASMSDEAAVVIGVPLKLKSTIASLLDTNVPPLPSVPLSAATIAALPNLDTAPVVGKLSEEPETSDWEHLSLEDRVCPPLNRFGYKFSEAPNATSRSRPEKYALGLSELTPLLNTEFHDLMRFGTQRFFGAQQDPIAVVTAEKYAAHLRGMLGWLHRVRGMPIQDLSLRSLIPSSDRDGVFLAFEYVQWLSTERGVGIRTELIAWRSLLHCAKFVHHKASNVLAGSGEKSYSDLGVVKEIRALINKARKTEKVSPRSSDETVKWLDWPEYLRVCRELKKECAGRKSDGTIPRPRKDIAWSLQKYLIFRILASVPDRQRTLRELEVGRTLVQEEDGRWCIRHGPSDYKTGRSYGERPPLVIDPTIYPELEIFLSTWRAELDPRHNFVFTQANGEPLTDKSLYKVYWATAYRIAGKRFTPHLVRDSCVTFLRKGNASERELEALALYMGHSVEMQRTSYDRRTKEEKVQPAVTLLESLGVLPADD